MSRRTNHRKLVAAAGVSALLLGAGIWGAATRSGAPSRPPEIDAPRAGAVPAPPRRRRTAPQLIEAMRAATDAAAQRQIAQDLASQGDALAVLEAAYRDAPDAVVRERTLAAAALLGTPEAAAWLATVAESDARLGAHAGAALGTMTDPRAVPELRRLASGGPVIVRANAIRALGATGDRESADVLGVLVADASQPLRVRQEAALAVGRLGDASIVDRLVAALESASNESTPDAEQFRISLIQALGDVATPGARAALATHARRRLSTVERAFTERALATRPADAPG